MQGGGGIANYNLGSGSWVTVHRRAVPSTAARFAAAWAALCPEEHVKIKMHGRDTQLARKTRAFTTPASGVAGYAYSGQVQQLEAMPEDVGLVLTAVTDAMLASAGTSNPHAALVDYGGDGGATNGDDAIRAPPFNMCLVNFYSDGGSYCGYHSDDTRQLLSRSPIACVSWGAARRFALRPKKAHEGRGAVAKTFDLADGDLIVMGGLCQETHKHAIPKTAKSKCNAPRMSFTFRCFAEGKDDVAMWATARPLRPVPPHGGSQPGGGEERRSRVPAAAAKATGIGNDPSSSTHLVPGREIIDLVDGSDDDDDDGVITIA